MSGRGPPGGFHRRSRRHRATPNRPGAKRTTPYGNSSMGARGFPFPSSRRSFPSGAKGRYRRFHERLDSSDARIAFPRGVQEFRVPSRDSEPRRLRTPKPRSRNPVSGVTAVQRRPQVSSDSSDDRRSSVPCCMPNCSDSRWASDLRGADSETDRPNSHAAIVSVGTQCPVRRPDSPFDRLVHLAPRHPM